MVRSQFDQFDLITMGRIGVDLYPLRAGRKLSDVDAFGKFLGGSSSNVAAAAARLGLRTATISRTGRDPFGEYLREQLREFGVDERWVTPVDGLATPVTFCEIFPPDDFPLYFYREPKAPDLEIAADELDLDAIGAARVFWVTGTGLSAEPSRGATLGALAHRAAVMGAGGDTVFDLDWRPMLWRDPAVRDPGAARPLYVEALRHATVAVGNVDEVEIATGEREPVAAARELLRLGVRLAVVKRGPEGVLAMTADGERVEVPPVPVEVLNGLGAGDAFGGALCRGLVAGWGLERVMRYANAAGAIVASRLECSSAMPGAGEVERVLSEGRVVSGGPAPGGAGCAGVGVGGGVRSAPGAAGRAGVGADRSARPAPGAALPTLPPLAADCPSRAASAASGGESGVAVEGSSREVSAVLGGESGVAVEGASREVSAVTGGGMRAGAPGGGGRVGAGRGSEWGQRGSEWGQGVEPGLGWLARVRAEGPEGVEEAARRRERRGLVAKGGRLMIVAADHPARGALGVGERGLAMADRGDLLRRLCVALGRPGVDGVLASADVVEDLLLLGALEGKVVVGSMNRGGLAGASFELDDRFTGYRAEDLERFGFDAGKLLLRLDYDDPGGGSVRTLEAAARAVDAMAARRLPVFVEPFLTRRDPETGLLRPDLSPESVITSIAVASGLGGTSAYTWLKVPVTDDPDDMARVLAASSLPTVLLGGDIKDGDQEAVYERWRVALRLPTVRGLVVGRSLLYPEDGDVAGAVDTAVGLLRGARSDT